LNEVDQIVASKCDEGVMLSDVLRQAMMSYTAISNRLIGTRHQPSQIFAYQASYCLLFGTSIEIGLIKNLNSTWFAQLSIVRVAVSGCAPRLDPSSLILFLRPLYVGSNIRTLQCQSQWREVTHHRLT